MRNLFGIGVLVGMLASAVPAQAQTASLLKGSATGTTVQYQTVTDKAPLNAPIPAGNKSTIMPQSPFTQQPSTLSKITKLLKFPTLGSNPILSVGSKPKPK